MNAVLQTFESPSFIQLVRYFLLNAHRNHRIKKEAYTCPLWKEMIIFDTAFMKD